jgi:hypothetical protein
MRPARTCLVLCLALLAAGVPAGAVDRWEAQTAVTPVGDDDSTTINEPRHGTVQTHDYDSESDQDWVRVQTFARRSYEARVWSGSVPWSSAVCPPATCASFDMVDTGGAVVLAGAADGVPAASSVLRWIATNDQTTLLRTRSSTGLNALVYDLAFFDTTYALPRFNNTGTQVTVVILQNTRPVAVNGQIDFYNASGTHLHSQPFAMAAYGSYVYPSSTTAALQDNSGAATIAHTGGYGGLAGKAVALEPGTGFTFDTPITPLPY